MMAGYVVCTYIQGLNVYIYKSQDPEAEAIDDGDAAREAEPVSAEEAIQDILQS